MGTFLHPKQNGRKPHSCAQSGRSGPAPVADVDLVCECPAMDHVSDNAAANRLYLKALAVRYERHLGLGMPIMWHLALRGHTGAMIELADWFSNNNSVQSFGTPADAFSAAGLYYRAFRKGDARAATNAAMSCFNRNDMIGYRQWLRRGARSGDVTAKKQLRYFETRLWHSAARKIGRLRPEQKRDEFA